MQKTTMSMTVRNKRNKKTFLALIISLLTLSSGSFAQDPFDKIKDNSKLTKELKDVYRAFHINHVITEQKELLTVYQRENKNIFKELLTSSIKTCNSLKQFNFYNDTLNSFVKKYLTLTIQNYKILQSNGFSSNEYERDFEKYKGEEEKYKDYLYSTYSITHFVNMTEDDYWKASDKNNYVKSKDYSRYKKLKSTNLKKGLILLDSIIKKTSNFQEYTVYQIELADQYEKHRNSLEENATEIAITKYKSILDQKQYSIYLFEAWLKWRTVTQHRIYGASKTSNIPNYEYNKIREQVALTILNFVIKNPKDEMAINEFLLVATHDIERRYGAYLYGNQSTAEYYQMFDNIK